MRSERPEMEVGEAPATRHSLECQHLFRNTFVIKQERNQVLEVEKTYTVTPMVEICKRGLMLMLVMDVSVKCIGHVMCAKIRTGVCEPIL